MLSSDSTVSLTEIGSRFFFPSHVKPCSQTALLTGYPQTEPLKSETPIPFQAPLSLVDPATEMQEKLKRNFGLLFFRGSV